ncbi:small acid-soluble spore protein SspI [Paenibacillus sp. HJGM_3]|uniref:small acid-soluble spore protein SspI n=1 Tax=Paenibacillus sp. HJGM_3 TaxID=3379816 RepID=UPI00385B74D4
MDLDLRQAIIGQVKNNTTEQLHEVIMDSVHQEEKLLPGLGVLFEIIWDHSDPTAQNQMVQTLKDNL